MPAKRAKKKKPDNARARTVAVAVFAVVVGLGLAVAVFAADSDWMRRHTAALEAGGTRFSWADYGYYRAVSVSEFAETAYRNFPQYADQVLPSNTVPLDEQTFDEETGETWEEFYDALTRENMRIDGLLCADAKKNGFSLSRAQKDGIDEEIGALGGGGLTAERYLRANYGRAMTEKTYARLLELRRTAAEYEESVRLGFSYAPAELAAYYADNKDRLDSFGYRVFTVRADGALAAALARAEELISRIDGERDFIAAAREYDAEKYPDDGATLGRTRGGMLPGTAKAWFTDAARRTGDIFAAPLLENLDEARGYYVYYFISRESGDWAAAEEELRAADFNAWRAALLGPEMTD
jgi:hypothetical protein